jgi:Rrf2 family iron-sulfur cluster assembly transcriptional regulator
MRITTKSRHAISSMLELTTTRSPVKLSGISESCGISLSYLEQIFSALRTKGLVKGQRGPGGGYVLARNASEISIADIICAVDEWVDYAFSQPRTVRSSSSGVSTRVLWDDLSQGIFGFLSELSLQDIASGNTTDQRQFENMLGEAA